MERLHLLAILPFSKMIKLTTGVAIIASMLATNQVKSAILPCLPPTCLCSGPTCLKNDPSPTSVPSSGMLGKFMFLSNMVIAIPSAEAAVQVPGGNPTLLVNDNRNNDLNLPNTSRAVFGNVLIEVPGPWPNGTLSMPIYGGIDSEARIVYEVALEPGTNNSANLRVHISNPDTGKVQEWLWFNIIPLGTNGYTGLMWSLLTDKFNTFQIAALTYGQQTGMNAGLIQPGLAVSPGTNIPLGPFTNVGTAFDIPWVTDGAGRIVYYHITRIIPYPVSLDRAPSGFIYSVYTSSNKLAYSFPQSARLENLQFDPRQPSNVPAGTVPDTLLRLQVQAAGITVANAFYNNPTNLFQAPPFVTQAYTTTQIQGYSGITPVILSGGVSFLNTPESGMTYLSIPKSLYNLNQRGYAPGVDFYTPDETTGQPAGDPNFGFSYVGGVPPGDQPPGFPGNP